MQSICNNATTKLQNDCFSRACRQEIKGILSLFFGLYRITTFIALFIAFFVLCLFIYILCLCVALLRSRPGNESGNFQILAAASGFLGERTAPALVT